MKYRILFTMFFCVLSASLFAQQRQQSRKNPSMLTYPVISTRTEVILPEVNGYKVIKADLHTHTIYSDGQLTSSARVAEAWRDGLDAIAITDHIETRLNISAFEEYLGDNIKKVDKNPSYDKTDMNYSVEGGQGAAGNYGITLIPGIEITRNPMEVGHFNALFTTDNNLIPDEDPLQSVRNAKAQDAIVQINHPGWARPDNEFTPVAEAAIKEGLISGVEVFNSYEFYPEIIEKATGMGFYVCCGSDLHITSYERYGTYGMFRNMTLILAKDSSLESIREALEHQRTLAYAYGDIAGSEQLLKDFFCAAVSCKVVKSSSNGRKTVQITNNSSFPYVIALPGSAVDVTLKGFSSVLYTGEEDEIPVTVTNMWFGADKHPSLSLVISGNTLPPFE